jgi:flagellar biosynthetic protein FlhB
MAGGDKTEKPTPQRLKKAREQGQFLSARGMVGAVQFVVMVVVLRQLIPEWQSRFQLSVTTLLEHGMTREIGPDEWTGLLRTLFMQTLIPVAVCVGIVLLITGGAHLAISKMGFSLGRLTPKFDRFNPVSKLKELPAQNLKSVIEAVLLLGVLGVTINSFAVGYAQRFLHLSFESVPAGAQQIGASVNELLWAAAGVFIAFGSVDLFRQYRKHMSMLKMTKQEVKEEHKRNEGDPQLKGRIRRLRRDLLRKQMMRDVANATAVVVNPTHFAVALRYELDTMSSPVCVGKGKNWIALKIREIAVKNDVPLVENPPLARALYDALEVGRTIPPEFYKAVAEILAYIYRVMGPKLPD